MDKDGLIESIFGRPRALIGVVHTGALPGTPRQAANLDAVQAQALEEAEQLAAAGFDGLILENMHDRPYLKRSVGPEIVAAMTAIAAAIRRSVDLPLGVQILAGANREALAVAQASGAAFIRAEGLVFAHVADEGLFESDAGELLRYRRQIGTESVRIFADIKKKHSAHALTSDVDLVETAHAAEFFLADGLVVTGAATGRATSPAEVAQVAAATGIPTLVGSGVTPENVADYAAADALIVGSCLKRDGLWSNELVPERAAALAQAFRAR